ncbi:AAA-type ATPase, N-terminal domain containing protein [Trema orientale]|uniref:AAA-type ATPase, N-terminal domain containing protein n=1 Tax=Trema orientale TaxID=63057 RepID=A0A2P5FPC3_TREOI|nr:AAA-type ATPase, N-terminal domain containing protein [Trema orientale]
MFSINEMPSPSSLFLAFASITASIVFFQSMLNQILPEKLRNYLIYLVHNTASVFDEGSDFIGHNQVYKAAGVYLDTLRSPRTERLNVHKSHKEKDLIIRLENGELVTDLYCGIELHWRFVCSEQPANKSSSGNRNNCPSQSSEKRYYELILHKKHEDKVYNSYIPFVLSKAKAISDEKRVLTIYTFRSYFETRVRWDSIPLEHPATFGTLAIDPKKKNEIVDDLNRFLERKAFYKKVGRAWIRTTGYRQIELGGRHG